MIRRILLTFLAVSCVQLAALFILPAGTAHAGVAVDISIFYDELAPYGDWVSINPYGWVWCPYNTRPGWRPYTDGHWAYTDFGWTWVSDVEWGWAAYHYGRWFYDDLYGWVWVPGTVWGPAWVAWRYGDGYVGWAPLPPDVAWMDGRGLDWGRFDFDVGFQWYSWNFADEQWLCKAGLRNHIYGPERNTIIMRKTQNVTRYVYVNNRIMDRSLDVDRFEQSTHQRVPRFVIAEQHRSDRRHMARITGTSLELFRPQISKGMVERTPPHGMHRPINYEAYGRKLDTYHRQQIRKLESEQKKMMKTRRPGASADRIREDNRKAVDEVQRHQQTERRVLENRAKNERERSQRPSEPKKSGGRGRGRGRGRH
jgi:hypothetical protein